MFCNNKIYRWNIKKLSYLISFNFNILKIMAAFFAAVQRMLYYLIRIINHFKSCSWMTFLTSRFLTTLFTQTLGIRFYFGKIVTRRRFTAVSAVLI